jgi:AGCS family alanine or glycine:cation symporter
MSNTFRNFTLKEHSVDSLVEWLNLINSWVWGPALLLLLVGTGLYLTIVLRGLQFRHLGYALKLAFSKDTSEGEGKGDISHFQALMTALAATIGIGNIAGVATAVAIGGVGAIFWMWVAALLGMATKYAEAILAIKFRSQDKNGQMSGGPMYYIQRGLGWKWLAISFAFFGAIAAFGTGNFVQSHTVAEAIQTFFPVSKLWVGIALGLFTGLVLLGGINSIGKLSSIMVPFMAIFYMFGGITILVICMDRIPEAFSFIVSSAFNGQAAFGGFAGSSIMTAIQFGVARGVFSNEAGLGTASIAAAAAKTDSPGRQALVSMTGAFLATIVVCSITGLVLAVTQVVGTTDASGVPLNGAPLTIAAFESVLPGSGWVVTVGIILFAYTTIVGWAYYGEKCSEFLFGSKSVPVYRFLFSIAVVLGSVMSLDIVWPIADIFNGLMAIPNLIALLGLATIVVKETQLFEATLREEKLARRAVSLETSQS